MSGARAPRRAGGTLPPWLRVILRQWSAQRGEAASYRLDRATWSGGLLPHSRALSPVRGFSGSCRARLAIRTAMCRTAASRSGARWVRFCRSWGLDPPECGTDRAWSTIVASLPARRRGLPAGRARVGTRRSRAGCGRAVGAPGLQLLASVWASLPPPGKRWPSCKGSSPTGWPVRLAPTRWWLRRCGGLCRGGQLMSARCGLRWVSPSGSSGRRCQSAIGLAPKVLHRMLRFQEFLALVQFALSQGRDPADDGLGLLAADAGYADQSHLTRECVRLTGLTPQAFLAETQPHCGCGHEHEVPFAPLLPSRPAAAPSQPEVPPGPHRMAACSRRPPSGRTSWHVV